MHQSIATIDSPEFINLQPLDLNPLMSSCEIKVLYVGENRNKSFITKEVATEMSKTLRGAPIVGYFKNEKQDFVDHGDVITLDDEGIHFSCLTKPYGFVSPDAQVWFQKFEEQDDFGNTIIREYLMTTGYLWTGQFEECQVAINEGRPQSMELHEDTLDGYWSTNVKTNMEFFIINDAIFSKLCILGNDVEPCFEGAEIKAFKNYSLDNTFRTTLFNMMQDLKKFVYEKGEHMKEYELKDSVVTPDTVQETAESETIASTVTQYSENSHSDLDVDISFVKKEDKEKEGEEVKEEDTEKESEDTKEDVDETEKEKEVKDEKDDVDDDSLEDEEDKKKKPAKSNLISKEQQLQEQYDTLFLTFENLKEKYKNLEKDYKELVEFKNSIEDAKKDELIKSFYMLSDEDKKDVIENKSMYSYDEIEAKLSVMCVRKKVSFDLEDNSKNENKKEETPVTTFNLNDGDTSVPAWVNALKNARKQRNK